jgi:predicted enzyme related to lactoylglutathione lyase
MESIVLRRGRVLPVEFHTGRLLDHVHVRVSDLERSKAFYRALLASLGREPTFEHEGAFAADELYVSADAPPTTGLHFAFQTPDRETVDRFHAAALAAGALSITSTTTARSSSTRTATTSRRCTTGRRRGAPTPS